MKKGRKGLAMSLLLAILVAWGLALIVPAYASEGIEEKPYDCNLLLAVFYNSLRSLLEEKPNSTLIKAVSTAPLPLKLEKIHRRVYRLLLDLARLETRLEEASAGEKRIPKSEYLAMIATLYTLLSGLKQEAARYVDLLSSCAEDRALSKIMTIESTLLLDRLPSFLYRLEQKILRAAYPETKRALNITLILTPLQINASSPRLELCVGGLEERPRYLVEYTVIAGHNPSNIASGVAEILPSNAKHCALLDLHRLVLKPPSLPFFARAAKIPLWLVAKIVDANNNTVYGPELRQLTLLYFNPLKYISIPSTVSYGSNITVRAESLVPVNITIAIGGVKASKIMNGASTLNISAKKIRAGYYRLEVLVVPINATGYASISYAKALAVEAEPVKADIIVSNPTITIFNRAKVRIVGYENKTLIVRIKIGSIETIRRVKGSSDLLAPLPFTLLPWVYNVNITVTDPSSSLSSYYSDRIIVINPLGIAVLLVLVAFFSLIRDDIDLIKLLQARRPLPAVEIKVVEVAQTYYEALKIKIKKSKIARAYYSALKKLGLPLPKPPQTLREHWRSIVEGMRGEEKLYSLMLEAERDLYREEPSSSRD